MFSEQSQFLAISLFEQPSQTCFRISCSLGVNSSDEWRPLCLISRLIVFASSVRKDRFRRLMGNMGAPESAISSISCWLLPYSRKGLLKPSKIARDTASLNLASACLCLPSLKRANAARICNAIKLRLHLLRLAVASRLSTILTASCARPLSIRQ